MQATRMMLALVVAAVLVGSSAAADTGARDPERAEQLESIDRDAEKGDWLEGRRIRLTASTGLDYTSGDYGGPMRSEILNVPFGLKFEFDPFVLRVSIPYVRVDGGILVDDGVPVSAGAPSGTRDGIGDIVVAASYVFLPSYENDYLPIVELTGKVKIGTASASKGLGTGETDYILQGELSKSFGRVTPFVSGGYKFIGDPTGFNLNDKAFASTGASYRLCDWLSIGAAYDWSESSVSGRPDSHELSPFGSIKLGRHFRIDPYAVVGLSRNAPEWGGGLQLRFVHDWN